MALKSDFEDSDVISSPFVDEIANPGSSRELRQALESGRAEALPRALTENAAQGDFDTRDAIQNSLEASAKRRLRRDQARNRINRETLKREVN